MKRAFIGLLAVATSCAGGGEGPTVLPTVGCAGDHSDPELEYVYVVDRGSDTVSVVNPRSCTVATTVQVGREPVLANASASGAFVYVANRGDQSLTLIETDRHTVEKTIPLGFAPEEMKFDAAHVHRPPVDREPHHRTGRALRHHLPDHHRRARAGARHR